MQDHLIMRHTKESFPTLLRRLSKPQYRGKHVVIMKGKIFAVRTGKQASHLLDQLTQKYPLETPTISYIPKADALILLQCKK